MGLWLSIDPLQSKYPEIQPYSFAASNPINLIDADGKDIIRFTEKRVHTRQAAFPSKANHGANFRDVIATTYTVTVIQQPGVDKFFYDMIDIDASAHNKPQLTTIQFYPNEGFAKRSGVTESYSTVFDIPLFKTNDYDWISLEKLAPQNLVNYLEKHDPKIYGGLGAMQEDRAVREGVSAVLAATVLWENPEVTSADIWKGPVDYSLLKEPNIVGPGLETTTAQRARILQYNKKMNNGVLRSDIDGSILDMPTNTPKGGKANINQAEIDHVFERSSGGTNSNSNLRVISKKQNLIKELLRRKK